MATEPPDLDRLFSPRLVAVVGASDSPGKPSTLNWRRVRDWADWAGARVVPVNPNRSTVDGLPTVASLDQIDEPVDVAVLLVSDVDPALKSAAAVDVAFVVVFAAGFAELGAEGAARQAELVALLDGSDTRMLGPNTNMNVFEFFRRDLPGKAIALITQSGHQGRPVFQGQELGIRFSHWAPTGNEADLESSDFISYFAGLPDTGAIAAYLEGFADGRSFQRAAATAARHGVPLVIVKVGRTDVGRSWAASHTGHLAGADDVTSAVMRQYGVTRVDGLDELLDTAALFARTSPPATPGICVYSISGGTSAHMADLLTAAGLDLPPLTEQTQQTLRQWIPGYLRIDNPIDCGGHPVGDERGRKILDTVLADPNVGILVVPITGAFPPMSDRFVADLVAVSQTTDKPICVVWGSPSGTEEAYRSGLLGSRLPVFRTFGNCVSAVRALVDFGGFTDRIDEMVDPLTNPGAPTPRPGRLLTERQSKQLLSRYRVPVSRDVFCPAGVDCADSAVAAAADLGTPVVLKAVSQQIPHKSDHGLVRTGVRAEAEIRSVVADFTAIVDRIDGATLDGVLVCEQVSDGVEMVLGIAVDEVFGPVVMAGVGGVAVEIYRDVTFRMPPFGRAEAHRMLTELRGYPLLTGHRGRPPADLDALLDAVMAVQELALSGEVAELDINPLAVTDRGVVALDALVRTAADSGSD